MNRQRQIGRIASFGLLRKTMICSVVVLLSSCAVGPDYKRPQAPPVKAYTATAVSTELVGGKNEPVQQLVTGKTISQRWWQLYRSPHLDRLLTQAIANSPDLAAAKATLAQAQETLLQSQGAYYPQLDLAASARRQHSSGTSSNLYSVGADVSYAPDVFGGTRREVERATALVAYQHYQLAAAYLALTGNTVTQAIQIASVRQQLGAFRDIIRDDEHNLHLVTLSYKAGRAARSDVLTAQSQLASDRAQLPPLKQQLSVAQHALSVLVGKFPAQWPAPEFALNELNLPTALPVTVPSKLVRQRPDILAAEAQLHADSAAIGVAASQLYPNIQLSGALGVEALTSANLFQSTNKFWNLVASLTAPIFHGGELAAQEQVAVYAFQASAATYQHTVLNAFAQVADLLRALGHDAELVGAQQNALEISQTALKLQRLSYAAGKSDVLQLLDAERSYQQARLGYARAVGQRLQDTAELFVAMGGGWWQVKSLTSESGMQTAKPVRVKGE